MQGTHRWNPCIAHREDEATAFVEDYFSSPHRNVLLVAGAGFDPRSLVAPTLLHNACDFHALFIKEIRPEPPQTQSEHASENTKRLLATSNKAELLQVRIWEDNAVVGGRNVIKALRKQDYENVTDIVVDISALSIGTSFPVIRYFVEDSEDGRGSVNLHLLVTHNPAVDERIHSVPGDVPSYIHGFKGQLTLAESSEAARLWLPQLASGRRGILRRLFDFVNPHDTCPILPFPSSDPRRGDRLTEEYLTEIENTWSVDARDLVYADEGDPLDLYRTILKLDDVRKPVFSETGGSKVILSPAGSKVMAIGALMAAMERNLPVAYVEPIGYDLINPLPMRVEQQNLIHIWLEGDAYPQPRPPLST